MNFFLEKLQKGLKAPFKLRSVGYHAPSLPEPVWDCAKEAKSDHFTVGVAKEDLTPPDLATHRYYMAGYGFFKPVQGFLNPVCATALWLDDNSGRGGVLLVSVDCVGIMHSDVEQIRRRLAHFCRITG
jgi:hypothetical protein